MVDEKLLSIYLNDHLAASVGGLELAKRVASSNKGTDLGRFLDSLAREIGEDQDALVAIMDGLGMSRNPVKQAAGWMAEKAGRLKLNGRITGYSPLSRLVELEGLVLGVTGKLSLWRSLERIAASDERLARPDLESLISRAEAQLEGLERHHLDAAALAFAV